jgi:dihydrofolate synthase/folylpolyglutamate synthase
MTVNEALEYIHSVSWLGSKPGLSRTRQLLSLLGDPHKKLKFIHVAGTNGKGSTCASIASILEHAGYKTGLYTSPFINVFNERMQINRSMISDSELASLTEKIKPYAESMSDHPTEFELITALAMQYFHDNGCDIVVLEVGMGGELDSTNIIPPPEVAVITALGLDHTRELGPTLCDIAKAKAGIIKHESIVVSYGGEDEADKVIAEKAKTVGAKLSVLDFSEIQLTETSLDGCRFSYKGFNLNIPLIGTYQAKNASLAIEAVLALRERGWKIDDSAIVSGIADVRWPGRFELLGRDPIFILDGAHNPHGMKATYKSLTDHFPGKKIVFITGVMADKDVSGIFSIISDIAQCFVTLRPNNPRAMSAKDLADKLRNEFGVDALPCGSFDDGVKKACEAAGKDGIVCALGSLYFSEDVRKSYEKTR